jgi:hypothetical protein
MPPSKRCSGSVSRLRGRRHDPDAQKLVLAPASEAVPLRGRDRTSSARSRWPSHHGDQCRTAVATSVQRHGEVADRPSGARSYRARAQDERRSRSRRTAAIGSRARRLAIAVLNRPPWRVGRDNPRDSETAESKPGVRNASVTSCTPWPNGSALASPTPCGPPGAYCRVFERCRDTQRGRHRWDRTRASLSYSATIIDRRARIPARRS